MTSWHTLTRDGVRLACHDFGGEGEPVLLLHGLAGHAGEWAQTASWLTKRCHVVAFDARGHGRSELAPEDVSRPAQVADAAFVIEGLELVPVVLVAQSVAGLPALSLAADRPELVRGLVLVEASPAGGPDIASAASDVGEALREWPVPFPSPTAALEFFHRRFGSRLAAEAWADGLTQREDGWSPRFDVEVMVRTLREAVLTPSWDEWERITCPTLVVRGGDGQLDADLAQEMLDRLPSARLVEIAGAGHDVHLDAPVQWRETLSQFLDSLSVVTAKPAS
jgi:pimeloyl-ACP methyl ester carboxylesterase